MENARNEPAAAWPAGRAKRPRASHWHWVSPWLQLLALAALACGGRAERNGTERSSDCAGETCEPVEPALLTPEWFQWTSGEPSVVMGSVDERVCLLTRVGGRFDAADDGVQIMTDDGQWLLGGSAASGFVEAGAACVAASGVTEEVSWVQGEQPLELYAADTHACFLTGVSGRFEGGAEVLSLTRSGSWYLSGASLQPDLAGSARCVPMASTSDVFGMEFDTPSPLPAPAEAAGVCYLTALCGHLDARGDTVETAWNGASWELRRQAGPGRSLRASAACLERTEPPAE